MYYILSRVTSRFCVDNNGIINPRGLLGQPLAFFYERVLKESSNAQHRATKRSSTTETAKLLLRIPDSLHYSPSPLPCEIQHSDGDKAISSVTNISMEHSLKTNIISQGESPPLKGEELAKETTKFPSPTKNLKEKYFNQ